MRLFSLILSGLLLGSLCSAAETVAVLPLFNGNQARTPSLDWIGESTAETIHEALSAAGLLVLEREEREEVYRRLSIRPAAVLTRASVIKIGETLDAGEVVFGDFNVEGSDSGSAGLRANMRIAVHVTDLRKFREAAVFEQSGPLETLSQMQMKLAWQVLNQLAGSGSVESEESFLRNRPSVRVDAMESYVRGLMSANADQRMKLFAQAARLDEHFSPPNFQLGRQLFLKKDYKTASPWLAKVMKSDSHYLEAGFLLGICRYYEGDFDAAVSQFRMVAAEAPLNEVFNNLGAALSRKNEPDAVDNLNKALEGDDADPDYWFNIGYVLWKRGDFAHASDKFRAVLDRASGDQEATSMLGRCLRFEGPRPGDARTEGRERIKTAFEDSAFRQLQAELRSKPK